MELFKFGTEVLKRLDQIITHLGKITDKSPQVVQAPFPVPTLVRKPKPRSNKIGEQSYRRVAPLLVREVLENNGVGKLTASLAQTASCSSSTILRVVQRLTAETTFIQVVPSSGGHGATIRISDEGAASVWLQSQISVKDPHPQP